jgi:hypothetical protein
VALHGDGAKGEGRTSSNRFGANLKIKGINIGDGASKKVLKNAWVEAARQVLSDGQASAAADRLEKKIGVSKDKLRPAAQAGNVGFHKRKEGRVLPWQAGIVLNTRLAL